MARALLFLYAESPVHAGGDASLGAVDLPIQREAGTGLPVIWGQSLKGALRSHTGSSHGWDAAAVAAVFGDPPPRTGSPETAGAGQQAGRSDRGEGSTARSLRPGTLSVGDAQLVAFPVPTIRETFAWVTSPLALGRLVRKAALADLADLPPVPDTGPSTVLAASSPWCTRTVIGSYVTSPVLDAATGAWARWLGGSALPAAHVPDYFARKLATDLLTVPDGTLTPITREGVELSPRVQLAAEEKTVAYGPFYSEYLPSETVLAAVLECSNDAHLQRLRALLDNQILRLGGNETIGKGLLWCRFGLPQTSATTAQVPAGSRA